MGAARYIKLTDTEDTELRAVETTKGLNEKVRLRAKVLRLSNLGMSVNELEQHLARHSTTILRDFDRWEANGIKGLVDGIGSGQASPLSQKHKDYLLEKLSEDRTWTAAQLCEALNDEHKLKVNRETMRTCLHSMGYSWQRHRYVPVKQPDAKLLKEKQAEYEVLKKSPAG